MNECPFRPDGRSLVSRQPATKLPNKAAHARFFSHSPKSSTLVPKLQPSRRLLCSSCVLRGREGRRRFAIQYSPVALGLLHLDSRAPTEQVASRCLLCMGGQKCLLPVFSKLESVTNNMGAWQTELRYHFSSLRLSDAINYITSQIRNRPQGLRRFVGLGWRWAVRSKTPNPYLGSGAAFGRPRHGQSRNGTKCRIAPKERRKQRIPRKGIGSGVRGLRQLRLD